MHFSLVFNVWQPITESPFVQFGPNQGVAVSNAHVTQHLIFNAAFVLHISLVTSSHFVPSSKTSLSPKGHLSANK